MMRQLIFLLILLASCSRKEPEQLPAAIPDPVYTVPATIDRTGATDVSDTLNAWLATVPDSSVISFPANSTYRLEGGLHFKDRHGLTVIGNGARLWSKWSGDSATITLIHNPNQGLSLYRVKLADSTTGFHLYAKNLDYLKRSRFHVNFENCTNIEVTGIRIDGPNDTGGPDGQYISSKEAQHGFNIQSCTDLSIRSSRVDQVWGDFFYVAGASRRVYIEHNTCKQNGRQGIAVSRGDSIFVRYNNISQGRRSLIDLEPVLDWPLRDIYIVGNYFGPGLLTWIAAGGKGGEFARIYIENNIIDGKSPNIVFGSDSTRRRGPVVVRGNISYAGHGNPLGAAWRFSYVDGLTVTRNSIPLQLTVVMQLVGVKGCTGVDVLDNTFPNGLGNIAYLDYGPLGGKYKVNPLGDEWDFRGDGFVCRAGGCADTWRMKTGWLYIGQDSTAISYDWKKRRYSFIWGGVLQYMTKDDVNI